MLKKILLAITLFTFISSPTRAETNIYQYTQANMLSSSVKNALSRAYVPNSHSGTVSVIDTATHTVIDTFPTGKNPQHVVPSYDFQTLWVLNNSSNTITPIDPTTGKSGTAIPVDDPYNLYFTPDGKWAVVVCEARKELQLRDPQTMALIDKIPTQCDGANHMDFTVDGHYSIVTCEYSGELMKVDMRNKKVIGYLSLNSNKQHTPPPKRHSPPDIVITADGHFYVDDGTQHGSTKIDSMPQDIRSTADGSLFFVADMLRDGVVIIDPIKFIEVGFIKTGTGTHAVYPSRDGKLFYVSNRGCHHTDCPPHGAGSVTVIDPVKKAIVATWSIPQGGSPDMGNITADGKELWLSGRYDSEVYVFNTLTGHLAYRIPVGKGPHGLTVWPQPGRFSLGHTGNMR